MKRPNVTLNQNDITIYEMNHPSCVTNFIRCVNLAIKRKRTQLNIICKCERNSIFPNACLPISALIQSYKNNFDIKFNIIIAGDKYLSRCNFDSPLDLDLPELKELRNPLDKIFMYSSEKVNDGQIAALVQAYIDCISRTTKCEEGVLNSLIWCINEVMDNVLVHSEENEGYIMAQYHRKNKLLAICVYDFGIGIYKSLLNGKHPPASEIDSLTMAIQEGVGDGKGQGNGLYGLYQIINENGGNLSITSGKSSIMIKNGTMKKYEDVASVSNEHAGTTVDFQLDLSQKINIEEALKRLNGFDGFDIRIDNMLQDNNYLRYDVYENCAGTGTRIAGEELRNDVINTIKRANAPIILDFIGIKTCSSSFIDEFLSKLILEMGILEFNKLVRIENMNSFVSHLFERSTAMRIHQDWQEVLDSNKKDNT